ncbi:hypothetical protein EV182_002581 [Spiromyces aspiralis]|uniref:Uncharacterized protein n=1 Tax=Spiromyces aspiralis TaxID=68401 RepID=A0ACC1HGK1_9FUNG|nr:hypothetical protein EV182_002581 [Spiromyces aspiralis]
MRSLVLRRVLGGVSTTFSVANVCGCGRQQALTVSPLHSALAVHLAAFHTSSLNSAKHTKAPRIRLASKKKVAEAKSRGGRAGRGQAAKHRVLARKAEKAKLEFESANKYVAKKALSREERLKSEAKLQLQRSLMLRKRRAPGLGHTPARFRLLPIPADPTVIRVEGGKRSASAPLTIKQLRKQTEECEFGGLRLRSEVSDAARRLLEDRIRARHSHVPPDKPVEVKPTTVQALAIPELQLRDPIAGDTPDVFLAAETGSGKTFAYLLPIVSYIKAKDEAKFAASSDGRPKYSEARAPGAPYALIIVPSRNLVDQVLKTAKELSHLVKFSSAGIHLGMARRETSARLASRPVDVVVGTPSAFREYIVEDPHLLLGEVARVVIDEADTIVDDEQFRSDTMAVIDRVKSAVAAASKTDSKAGPQLVFSSATMPKTVHDQIYQMCPQLVHITTPSLHRTLPRLSQTFVDVTREFSGSKSNALLSVLRRNSGDRRTMVFCNKKSTARLVYNLLVKHDLSVLIIAGQEFKPKKREGDAAAEEEVPLASATREEIMNAFLGNGPIPDHLLPHRKKGNESSLAASPQGVEQKVLVCTDIVARGVDTLGVAHVVLYDFPTTVIDYLHRCGRTARAGSRGKVTALVSKKDKRLVDMIRLATKQGAVIS